MCRSLLLVLLSIDLDLAMSFFGRIFHFLASDAAVNKLANTKVMQVVAEKVVALEKHAVSQAQQFAKDPEAAKVAASQEVGKVWSHFKNQVVSDVERLVGNGAGGKKGQ